MRRALGTASTPSPTAWLIEVLVHSYYPKVFAATIVVPGEAVSFGWSAAD